MYTVPHVSLAGHCWGPTVPALGAQCPSPSVCHYADASQVSGSKSGTALQPSVTRPPSKGCLGQNTPSDAFADAHRLICISNTMELAEWSGLTLSCAGPCLPSPHVWCSLQGWRNGLRWPWLPPASSLSWPGPNGLGALVPIPSLLHCVAGCVLGRWPAHCSPCIAGLHSLSPQDRDSPGQVSTSPTAGTSPSAQFPERCFRVPCDWGA